MSEDELDVFVASLEGEHKQIKESLEMIKQHLALLERFFEEKQQDLQ